MGHSPTALAVSDFNRDGHADIATANIDSDSVSVLLGGSGGLFSALNLDAGGGPNSLATIDLNHDLRPDLIVVDGDDDAIMTLLSIAPERFDAGMRIPVGTAPSGITTPDLNRDNQPDVVIANSLDGTITVLLANASGGLVPLGSFISGSGSDSGPIAVSSGDFNRDGFPDVVVANQLEDTVSLFLGNGTGRFSSVRTFHVDNLPTGARIGDVTGDQIPDIVAVHEGSDTVVILPGDGTGGVNDGDSISLETGGFPESVILEDVNGDGLTDIITADSFSDEVGIFVSRGGGAFEDRLPFPVGRSPFDVAVGDFNGDGRPDLVTANIDNDTVSILINTTPYTVLSGDVNGDRRVDKEDVAAWLAEVFDGDGDLAEDVGRGLVASVATADANIDGFITAADLIGVEREIANRHDE